MATRDPGRVSDGFTTLEGGMDSGLSPSLIRSNQVANAVNASMRGGYIKPRPGVNKRLLQFPGLEPAGFQDGKFQGAKPYRTSTGDDVLIASISGRIFKVDIANGFRVQDITIPGNPNSSLLEYAWMEQAEEFFVIQDGQSAPYIFNGGSARRAKPGEIPTGTVMSYHMGRLWIASPDRRQFIASDLVYGPSGTSTYGYRDSVLKMTENDLLVTGGAFSIPDSSSQITAMKPIASLDTSTGQGPLIIFTETQAASVNAPVDRSVWKQVTYPIQTVSMIGAGPSGQGSVVHVNSDIWFRNRDDIRSFIVSRRNFQLSGQNTWANTGMSDELRDILDLDQRALLGYASSVNFDKRLLVTISPVWTPHGTYFRGLAALDFATVSGIGRHNSPVWNGVWSGLKILKAITATVNKVERCFLFVLSAANKIELWELSRQDKTDSGTKKIVWSYDSRSFVFPDAGLDLKQLVTGQHAIDELTGQATFTLKFRPDQYPIWIDWTAWSECAKSQDCSPPKCGTPQTGPKQFLQQYRPDVKLPRPPETCNDIADKMIDLGHEFQVRETIEGYCRIKKLRLHAHQVEESPLGECPGVGECKAIDGCDFNPFSYTAE